MATYSRQLRLVAVIALMILQAFVWHRLAAAAMTGVLDFDQAIYEGPNSVARLYLFDFDQTASVSVKVTSTSDTTGFSQTLAGSGGYSLTLRFGAATNAAEKTIQVADGDTVTVQYDDPAGAAGPAPVTASITWYNRAAQPAGD